MIQKITQYIKAASGIILILAIIIFLCLPIHFPYLINSTAKAFPVQQWVLQKNQDGTLISSWHNYQRSQMKDYTSYQFDRGDVVNIQFKASENHQNSIEKDAIIAAISSNKLQERLLQLQNQLLLERAALNEELSGNKIALVQEAEEALRLAKQELEIHKKRFERSSQLFAEGLIAKATYETAENTLKEAEIKIHLAQRQIEVNTTGEKPEIIRLIKTKIQTLEKEVQFLKTQTNYFEIKSPISGKLYFETNSTTDKLIVEDTSAHILVIPIKLKDRPFITKDALIELKVIGIDTLVQAKLLEIGKKVSILNRETVVLAKAKVAGNCLSIASGMPIRCQVNCGEVTPWEYLKRSVEIDLK